MERRIRDLRSARHELHPPDVGAGHFLLQASAVGVPLANMDHLCLGHHPTLVVDHTKAQPDIHVVDFVLLLVFPLLLLLLLFLLVLLFPLRRN